MSDTRNHTTRDQLAEVVADAICGRGDRPTYSPDQPCRAHLMQAEDAADALLASDAIAAVRAAAVAETTAAIETVLRDKEREAQPLSQSVNPVAAGEASGIHMTTHAVRAALSGGRTALDTTLAQARADALREAADAWTQGEWANHIITASDPAQIRIGSANRFGQWLRDRADTGADQ